MAKKEDEEIEITALLKRFSQQRFPRAQDLEKRVNAGGTLSEADVNYLESVFYEAKYILPLADRHPEHQLLLSKAIHMYKDIMQKALENEQKANPKNKL